MKPMLIMKRGGGVRVRDRENITHIHTRARAEDQKPRTIPLKRISNKSEFNTKNTININLKGNEALH